MPVKAGAAMVWNGESNNFYTTSYQRKDNCLSHETYGRIERADEIGCSVPAETIFAATDGTRLLLDRDLLVGVECPSCKIKKSVLRPVALVTLRDGKCEKCGAMMRTNIVHVVEAGTPLAKRTLREVGVAPFDIIKVEGERRGMYIRLEGDRAQEMAWS